MQNVQIQIGVMMQTSKLQTSSLLHHNPDFQVLICRECEYAIQKSAIDGHLLKHKIYRGDRQRLLAEISQLQLLEPDDVRQPSAGLPPVEYLTVHSGYRCAITGCQHLTISEKRIKRHWSQVHGSGESVPSLDSFCCTVTLQTFFKGARVRYFEVATATDRQASRNLGDDGSHRTSQSEIDAGIEHGVMAMDVSDTAPSHPSTQQAQISAPSPSQISLGGIGLDLNALQYFYYFVDVTIATLPGTHNGWRSRVIPEALQHNGLMCGLLAISAAHLAVFGTGCQGMRRHIEHQATYTREYFRVLQDAAELTQESLSFKDSVASLVRCADWAVAKVTTDRSGYNDSELGVILDTIRRCAIVGPATSPNLEGEANFQTCQRNNESTDDYATEPGPNLISSLSSLRTQIRNLPFRMAQVLDKPRPDDLYATLSAIALLVDCCEISFGSDDTQTVWRGMSTWLCGVSAHFNAMIARRDAAATVIVAYWAVILLDRAENGGCWFLKGATKGVLQHVYDRLSAAEAGVLGLVDELLDGSSLSIS